jgi:hypothetical protein
MIALMRQVGMNAFQTVLVPNVAPDQVKRLNHLSMDALLREPFDAQLEIDRPMTIVHPVHESSSWNVYLSSDISDVLLNVAYWNTEMADPAVREMWSRRTVTYFIYDQRSSLFAPSKFCAYLTRSAAHKDSLPLRAVRRVPMYIEINRSGHIFDGGQAQTHLQQHLAMRPTESNDYQAVASAFAAWIPHYADAVAVHPQGPLFLVPPPWFV